MAPWGSWDPEPPSEVNTVVTGRDFTVVDLPTDKINERKYGTASPEPTEHHVPKDLWASPYAPERRPFQHQGSPREVPCLQCVNRMMVRGFHGLCRDHLANASGKCYCCVLHGVECEEVPETAFKSAYELQVCARKMDEGHEDTDWEYLSNKAELALMKEGLLWFAREDTNDYWHGNNHVKEVVNGKVNQVNISKTYWNDGSNTNRDVNANANQVDKNYYCWDFTGNSDWSGNDNANRAGNDNINWGANGIPRWGSGEIATWNDKRNTNWGGDSDSDSDKGRATGTASDAEVDNDCDDESDDGQDPIQLTPEFSSADKIISAIDRNTDVVADLCEIMEGIKGSLDLLHEDNVQSKKVLQKLLTEQRTLSDKQT
ncbi:hypothetical protein NCS57_00030700 [Fusarium keratoplasticum]|uniref:Uncharacterized protein n=1 Tax=Fusarium keratoplasticum TaxID=1328300 RepID=A0ACC0RDY6_9HYPO|nr:hypothetical protein NCS57_00030700 [Fusarium keratoplasticum]KAI8683660.1 hypothetical protein NCS57_00030700 [Fusarium keratoplasticum]